MNLQDYKDKAKRTLSKCENELMDDIHMVSGMITESAEIMDVYKKHIAYGKPLDLVNVKEEIGDLMWYIINMCNLHDWNLEDIMQTNIDKLSSRYPEKFTNEKAINRDLETERKILENGK